MDSDAWLWVLRTLTGLCNAGLSTSVISHTHVLLGPNLPPIILVLVECVWWSSGYC